MATVAELRLQVAADTYVYRDMITNPSVVVEVLSELTEAWDRGGKFAQYRRVVSLMEYVPVAQVAMRAEWVTREEGVMG